MSRTKGYLNKKPRESALELSNWGLSKNILRKYNRIGITKLFNWQMNCLRLDGVLDKQKNLVYSSHASVGKLSFIYISGVLLFPPHYIGLRIICKP